MSFSFSVRAATAALAIALVEDELAKVVKDQPAHVLDLVQVRAVVTGYANLLPENPDEDVTVSCNGWVSTRDGQLRVASVSVTVGFAPRDTPAA